MIILKNRSFQQKTCTTFERRKHPQSTGSTGSTGCIYIVKGVFFMFLVTSYYYIIYKILIYAVLCVREELNTLTIHMQPVLPVLLGFLKGENPVQVFKKLFLYIKLCL